MWIGIAALRAKATMAVPPSQQNWLAGVTAPPRAAVMDARFSLGNTASIVAPLRSRATMTGICSAQRPRLAALPPLLREARGMPDRLSLKDSRINVSSPSTIPAKFFGLSRLKASRNRCLHRTAVVSATSHRPAAFATLAPASRAPACSSHLIFLPQMGQPRFRQSVEGPPAAFAAVSWHATRLSPKRDLPAAAMGAPQAVHPTLPESGQAIRLSAAQGRRHRWFRRCRRAAGCLSRYRSHRLATVAEVIIITVRGFGQGQRLERLSPLRPAQSRDPARPLLKLRNIHRGLLSSEVATLTDTNK